MPVIRDGEWTLLEHDFHLKRSVWIRELGDGRMEARTDYAVDDTIEANKAMRNEAKSDWAGDWHKVASIPLNVFHDQLAEATRQDDDRFVNRWLNDSENRAWRTKLGRV